MTDRAYYFDSYTRSFTTRVSEQTTFETRPAVVLDQTFFYPSSGGQPNDLGALNGVRVENVVVRESDKAILHVLASPLNAGEVQAALDWPRRFDHMQQHTGQHILSQAFILAAEALTVGFHLGDETVTIDLDADKLSASLVDRAEQLANEAVIANHPVRAWFPAPDELANLVLRKTPDVDGPLRVVAIGDFDLNACGGTHVKQSAEVGLIKILKTEKQKKGTRVEFICGQRALADYGRKHGIVSGLASDFTCGIPEVTEAVSRLRTENQGLRKDLRSTRDELLDYEANRMQAEAVEQNGVKVVRGAWPDRDMAELRGLASRLTAAPGVVALVGAAGEKANFVFTRSSNLGHDMNKLFKSAMTQLDGARGGGSPTTAQGGGVKAGLEAVNRVLEFAEKELMNA